LSTYRLKSTVRKPKRRFVNQGTLLKRKRLTLLDNRRRDLARATQHFASLEKLYTEGAMKYEQGKPTKIPLVLPNVAIAEQMVRARKEMLSIAESLPR
jgi:hypothetical protein